MQHIHLLQPLHNQQFKNQIKTTMKITLTEDQIKMLEAWAQELPTKYGMSFIQFLAQQVQEQNPKEEAE